MSGPQIMDTSESSVYIDSSLQQQACLHESPHLTTEYQAQLDTTNLRHDLAPQQAPLIQPVAPPPMKTILPNGPTSSPLMETYLRIVFGTMSSHFQFLPYKVNPMGINLLPRLIPSNPQQRLPNFPHVHQFPVNMDTLVLNNTTRHPLLIDPKRI
eukprot:Ihof_evm4s361 gene=Ihof_evmTU4s361